MGNQGNAAQDRSQKAGGGKGFWEHGAQNMALISTTNPLHVLPPSQVVAGAYMWLGASEGHVVLWGSQCRKLVWGLVSWGLDKLEAGRAWPEEILPPLSPATGEVLHIKMKVASNSKAFSHTNGINGDSVFPQEERFFLWFVTKVGKGISGSRLSQKTFFVCFFQAQLSLGNICCSLLQIKVKTLCNLSLPLGGFLYTAARVLKCLVYTNTACWGKLSFILILLRCAPPRPP